MRTWIAGSMAVIVLGACAHKPPAEGATPEGVAMSPSVTLEVTNNISPPTQVTAYIQVSTGGRRTLGTVSPGRTQRFTYSPTNASDKFTFVAQGTGGRAITSQTFTLINVATAGWDMQANLVKFYETTP